MRIFTNPDVLPKTWYAVVPAADVPRGQVRKVTLFDRTIAVFRGEDGRVRALDDRCPHLGADLSRGAVVGDALRCEMHHWTYGPDGRCRGRPSGGPIPTSARTFSYPVEERYGFVWVFNGPEPRFPVPAFDRFPEGSLEVEALPQAEFACHAHVATLNGLDAEHMGPVHRMAHRTPPRFTEVAPWRLEMTYDLRFTGRAPRDRLAKWLTRDSFRLVFTTWGGNTSLGEVLDPRFPLFMMFNHVPLVGGGTAIRPFWFSRRRRLGRVRDALDRPVLEFLADLFLLPDVGVLNAMRFWPRLTEVDAPLLAFVRSVEQLDTFDPRQGAA